MDYNHGYDNHRKSKRQLDGNSFERDISSSEDGDDANQSNERTMMQPCENSSSIQANYQSDRLCENAEDGNQKFKISNYTLKQSQRNRVGSYSLNPKQYSDSSDDTSVEDQSDEYSDESSMKELDKNRISSYALSGPVTQRHCIWFPPSVRAIIVGKSGSDKTTLSSYLLLAPKIMKYNNLIVCGSLHKLEYKMGVPKPRLIWKKQRKPLLDSVLFGCTFSMIKRFFCSKAFYTLFYRETQT